MQTMTLQQIADFKIQLSSLIALGETDKAIDLLKKELPAYSEKSKSLVLISGEHNNLKKAIHQNTRTFEQLNVWQAQINSNLLGLIDLLGPADFTDPSTATQAKKHRTGSVMYSIPAKMKKDAERQCIVRLAFDEALLIENFFQDENTHIRSIRRIEERMEVDLVDPNEETAFVIRRLPNSPAEQIVEEDDFTEWRFFVKPLKEGKHKLWLRVFVIVIMNDGQRLPKELVLEEEIEVVTSEVKETEPGTAMKQSGMLLLFGAPALVNEAPQDDPTPKPDHQNIPQAGTLSKITVSKLIPAVSVVALLTVAGWVFYRNTASPGPGPAHSSAAKVENEPVIDPPFSDSSIHPLHTLVIENPAQPKTFYLPSGTTIEVPGNTFTDAQGSTVTQAVTLYFREYNNAAQIIASGIPMSVYQNDGTEEWLQTAGMFGIEAYSGNKPLQIAPQSSVRIGSPVIAEGSFDVWYFDTINGNWLKTATANLPQKETDPALLQEVRRLRELTLRQPAPPAGAVYDKRNELAFVDLDQSCCPELGKSRQRFMYSGDNDAEAPRNNEWIRTTPWFEKKLLRTGISGVYLLQLIGQGKNYRIPVRLAGQNTDPVKDKLRYDSLVKTYNDNLALRREKEKLLESQATLRRQLEVTKLGIYNYDILWKKDDMIALQADFDLQGLSNDGKSDVTVYLITGENRTVVGFPNEDWGKFRFSPSADNKIIAVTPDGRIALFSQSRFNSEKENMLNAQRANRPYLFKLEVQDKRVGSLQDLEHFIQKAAI